MSQDIWPQETRGMAPALGKEDHGPSASHPVSAMDVLSGKAFADGSQVNDPDTPFDWMTRARDAYRFSTTFIENQMRESWSDSIAAFHNQHPSASKYNAKEFEKKSKLYRPKTRAIIRKIESAAAAAYFSNNDVLSIEPEDQSSKEYANQAAIMKELVEYRLGKSISWFQFVIGGLQDAAVTGLACSHIYWDTDEDKPQLELIPIENMRFDPGSNWQDPVNSSPYLIHLIPMFIGDVKERMALGDWKKLSESDLKSAIDSDTESTGAIKRVRSKGRNNAAEHIPVSDYEMIVIQRHIHRYKGVDYDFYTLSDKKLLSDPVKLEENVFHNKRPYVIGKTILETHTAYPSSIPEMSKGIQEEVNEIVNQRLENVKLAMNKRFWVKRGRQTDVLSLVRNTPGSVTMMLDPATDVKEINTPDVTQSSYAEQDRLNADFDDLNGNFTGAINGSNGQMAETAKGMELLAGSANLIVEYTLRTYTETFVEPVLRQLIALEQHYETDETILILCGQRAKKRQMTQGKNNQTPQMERPQIPGMISKPPEVPELSTDTDLTLRVNVGMGATSPTQRIQKLNIGLTTLINLSKQPMPTINTDEVAKEIFGTLGFGDGGRFINRPDSIDPQVAQLTQQVQQLTAALKNKLAPVEARKQIAHEGNLTKVYVESEKQKNENRRTLLDHWRAITEHRMSLDAKNAVDDITRQSEPGKSGENVARANQAISPQPQQQSPAAANKPVQLPGAPQSLLTGIK